MKLEFVNGMWLLDGTWVHVKHTSDGLVAVFTNGLWYYYKLDGDSYTMTGSTEDYIEG